MARKKTKKVDGKKRIAIIGGGISGLSMAYSLIDPARARRFGLSKPPFDIEIIERTANLGGNAETIKVTLGAYCGKGSNRAYERWVDLGVNDINTTSYGLTVKAMKTIGFKDLKPLEDTICYFSPDGSVVMTDDAALEHGVSDPRLYVPADLAEMNKRFMREAADVVLKNPDSVRQYTVAQYVDMYRGDLKKDSDRELLDEVARTMLYPRIAAMYFVDERGPQRMPLVAVMEYYILQENFPDVEDAKRMYFVGGSQHWIDRFADWLRGKGRTSKQKQLPRVRVRRNFEAKVTADAEGAWVYRLGARGSEGMTRPERFDKLVMATHADDALRSFRASGLSEPVAEMLGKVSYTNSIAVAHTFSGVLPPNRNAWRTYNVMIREGAAMTPYSMTYVINRHQNDADTRKYNKIELPQFFVTLSPAVRIPDKHVLRLTERSEKLRRKTGGAGYLKAGFEQHELAIGWFKHNVLDFDCLAAQDMLDDIQGAEDHRLYFAGGWTNGAGLHEQCFRQADDVAERIYEHEFGKTAK